jgi:hypothetical protein
MALKHAAFLALIGTILLAALQVWYLIRNVLNVLQGLVPAVIVLPSLIYAFAAFSLAAFFYAFRKSQS